MTTGNNNKRPVGPVTRELQNREVQQRSDEAQVKLDQETQGGVKPPEGEFIHLPTRLSNFQQSQLLRMEGGYQSIRLPGTGRIIHDRRRGEGAEGKEDVSRQRADRRDEPKKGAATDKKEMEIREGKMEEVRSKKYDNYLAERKMMMENKARELENKERQPSEFEKTVKERFEDGKIIEKMVEGGKFRFLAKKIEEWRAFFDKFADRTIGKMVSFDEVMELLFRGVVKKMDAKMAEAKAIVISDVILNGGKVDKFVRFGLSYQKFDMLSKLAPGDTIAKSTIADGSEKLAYLALMPPSAETEILTGLKPKQGMFAAEATEARVAEELGIALDKGSSAEIQQQQAAKGRKKRGRGMFSFFAGDEEPMIEGSGQFTPWWQWGNLAKPGGYTLKKALYSALFIAFVLAILFLIHQYLLGK